jgi:hypothetical protein
VGCSNGSLALARGDFLPYSGWAGRTDTKDERQEVVAVLRPETASRQPEVARGRHRWGLAACAFLISLSAFAGSAGLVAGWLSLGAALDQRLPLGSPVLGGIALAIIVGLPTAWLAWLAWRGDARADAAALLIGMILIGWILVELAFIREVSLFHPLYVVVGAVLIVVGRHSAHDLVHLLRP